MPNFDCRNYYSEENMNLHIKFKPISSEIDKCICEKFWIHRGSHERTDADSQWIYIRVLYKAGIEEVNRLYIRH